MSSVSTNYKLDSYEAICDYARERSEALDKLRWRLGDCANLIGRKYSEHTITDFARDIGQHKSTLYSYAKVSRFYRKSLRLRIFRSFPNINYSHMRDAMRLGDKRETLQWLTEVSTEGWTADEAARKLTEKLGHETRDTIEGTVKEIISSDFAIFAVFQLSTNTKPQIGQVFTLRAKG